MTHDQMAELAALLRLRARLFRAAEPGSVIAGDMIRAADLIDSMAQRVPQSVRERWNIERDKDGTLLVCFNEHEKGLGCRYERFVPESAQRVPLSEEQVFADDGIMAANARIGIPLSEIMEIVRATESAHGIRSEK